MKFLSSTTLFLILCAAITTVSVGATFFGTENTAALFTSPFFYPVYAILGLNLILCNIQHLKSRRRGLAFVLVHLGVVLVILGGALGHFSQTKGFMTLYQQKSDHRVYGHLPDGDWGVIEELPFTLFLDRFWIQHYEKDPNRQMWILVYPDGEAFQAHRHASAMPIGADHPKEHSVEDARILLEDCVPSGVVTAEEEGEPRLVLELNEGGERLELPIKLDEPIRVEQLKITFTPRKIFRHAQVASGKGLVESSDLPVNPAVQLDVENPTGSPPAVKYLFANFPDLSSEMGDRANADSPFFLGGESFRPLYVPPRYRYRVSPADPDAGGGIAAIKLAIRRGEETWSDWYFVGHPQLPSFRSLADDLIVEVADPHPPQVKDFKSKLSVFEGEENVVTKVIEVNHPLSHGGYLFYQNSYDQEGGRYTVLEVVRDPGLWWVMAGFALLMLGVIQKFYLDPFFGAKARKEAARG